MAAEAWLESSNSGNKLILAAIGSWTAPNARALEPMVEDAVRSSADAAGEIEIDVAGLDHLDTVGAWLIERLRRAASASGLRTAIVGLERRYQVLLDEVANSNKKQMWRPLRERPITEALDHIGRNVADTGQDLAAAIRFLGVVVVVFGRVLLQPHRFRITSLVHQLDRVAYRAVPIIVLINLLIGAILAQQGIFHFRKFGAENFVVDMVGILTLREVGVLLVSIMLAGRSGSAYTAELGSMKMNEEIDALRVMGFDPVEVLILPRMLALIIGLCLLTFVGSMAALVGGGIVCWLYGGFSPEIYIDRLREAITLDTFLVGMIKAPFMAAVIGLIAAVEGLRVEGSSESLGEHTTASVVKSIFLVIVLDGFFAMFFAGIGM